jgi:CBS domain-containing protein
VHGELSLARLDQILLSAGERGLFLPYLARAALGSRPPLGLFRRIRAEHGIVDLKRGGIAAIVALARVYSLQAGSSERSTLKRLDAAVAGGTLSRDGAETLGETFRFLTRLRLREQLRQHRAGEAPSNGVPLDALSRLELRHLNEGYRAILELQKATAQRFRIE